MRIRKPERLRSGDVIGVVSPASPLTDLSKLDEGVRYLESLGYRVMVGKNADKHHGFLAGSDRRRLSDLKTMFTDTRVKAILAVRGGYGTPRLLSAIDYDVINRNPKILVGFSDLTALQLAVWRRSRLVTFHGPMLGVDMVGKMDRFTEEMFWRMLRSPERRMQISFGRTVVKSRQRGSATGRLLGGNLSLVAGLLGTPYQPSFREALLFLEEVGEEPYRVDRMLTQLRNAGILGRVAGLLSGRFVNCVRTDPKAPSHSTEEVLAETARSVHVPFLSNLPFGHQTKKITLPIGVRARMNATRGTLELLESAVE